MKNQEPRQNTRKSASDTRRDYERQRIQRLVASPVALQPPPIVDDIVDSSDGTLRVAAINTDLAVKIPEWSLRTPGDTLQLQVKIDADFMDAGSVVHVPVDAPFPFVLHLPAEFLAQEGSFELRYQQEDDNVEEYFSEEVPLRVDRTPPYPNQNPAPLILPAVPITDDYLTKNPGGLVAQIPDYANRKNNDTIAVYYFNRMPPTDPDDLPAAIYIGAVPSNLELTIPAEVIRNNGDGGCYVLYVLADVAGNISFLSTYNALDVALGTMPSGMASPVVPLAPSDDDPIDLADVRAGVVVQIPAFANGKATDTFVVTWGSSALPREQLGSSPVFPFPVKVPLEVLNSEYTSASGKQKTSVSYELFRGTVSVGTYSTEIYVDLSVVGPGRPDPDPDWPGPNPSLAPLEVRGKISNKANALERADDGQPADVTLDLYSNAKDGEIIRIYWKGVHVTEADITVDTTAATPLTTEIPWSYIYDARNDPALPVHYTISAADDEANEDLSPITAVNADAVVLRAPPAEFQRQVRRAEGLTCNCSSLWKDPKTRQGEPAILVTIPDLTEFGVADGHVVDITFTPFKGQTGDETVGDPLNAKLTVGTDIEITGGEWEVKPYDKHILPMHDGSNLAHATVSFVITGGAEDITSVLSETLVSVYGANGVCPLDPVLAKRSE